MNVKHTGRFEFVDFDAMCEHYGKDNVVKFIKEILSLEKNEIILDKKILAKNSCRILYAIMSKNKTLALVKTVKECNNIFYNFVMGKALDSSIIFVITFIAMSIFKLKFTLLISVFVGITNMIPYFGPFIGAIPGIIILLIVNPVHAIIFTIEIIIIQQFDGLYLGPKILGDSCGIKPLWVIFGITIGGAYGGPFGMFVGVPLTAIIAHLINKLIYLLLPIVFYSYVPSLLLNLK